MSAPLTHNTMVIGAGAVQTGCGLGADVDLQVTVTEVRPDGKETFVQGGWLRTSMRKLDAAKSTLLEPVLSLRRADVAPLPRGRFSAVTIPLYYEGHVYRRGSRIRIIDQRPQRRPADLGLRPAAPARAGAGVAGPARPRCRPGSCSRSSPGSRCPTGLPPCPGLRGEPCRTYRPLS